ncbi:IS1595 family transposase, partial [Paracraurococcus sp. LOR1-02]|nr:IS1595 family transposase [Paracraurococcus sp. LOR1-02]
MAVAGNSVQFQKGFSKAEFERQYGTEQACREALFQCSTCRRQTSMMAGAIFAATKVTLRTWFRAIYHVTQTKQGVFSIELGRGLGVTQTTACTIK